jgi:hypothetical protein
MKRIMILSVALLAVLAVATGCSNSAQNNTDGNSNGPAGGGPGPMAGGAHRPDFGQPQKPADLRGVVTAVVGNQVTILKIAVTGGRRQASSTSDTSGGNASGTTRTPALALGATGGTRGGFGGAGGGGFRGGAGGGGSSTTDRAAMIAQLKTMSTGSVTITIPIGIKMMKFGVDPDTQQRLVEEATLADIATDKMITVWLNASSTNPTDAY